MTVADLLSRITSAELTEWFALAQIEAREREQDAKQDGRRGNLPAGPPQWGRSGW